MRTLSLNFRMQTILFFTSCGFEISYIRMLAITLMESYVAIGKKINDEQFILI